MARFVAVALLFLAVPLGGCVLVAGEAGPVVSTVTDSGGWPDEAYLASARQITPSAPLVVIVRPMASHFLDLPEGDEGEIWFAELYEVRFEIDRILAQGEISRGEEARRGDHVTVRVRAHARRWAPDETYILTIDPERLANRQVQSWQTLTRLACIDPATLDQLGLELEVQPATVIDGQTCVWP